MSARCYRRTLVPAPIWSALITRDFDFVALTERPLDPANSGLFAAVSGRTEEAECLGAQITSLSARPLKPTEAGRLHRHVGTRPGEGQTLLRYRRQFALAGSLQAFVIAAQAPDIVGVLT